MKTAEPTTTTHNRESSGNESTFFNESGGQGFFDKTGIHYSANTGNNRSPNNVFFPLGSIQPKLTIGQPNDKYEQEADAMADQVVQRLAKSDTIQPKCAACEQEENGIAPKLQFKPIFESDEPGLIQHKCDTCTQSEIHPIPIQTKNGSLPYPPGLRRSRNPAQGVRKEVGKPYITIRNKRWGKHSERTLAKCGYIRILMLCR